MKTKLCRRMLRVLLLMVVRCSLVLINKEWLRKHLSFSEVAKVKKKYYKARKVLKNMRLVSHKVKKNFTKLLIDFMFSDVSVY